LESRARHRAAVRSQRLRPKTAPIDARTLADPDVAFFQAANPGHADGDMLVCLAPLTTRNVLHAAWHGFLAGNRRASFGPLAIGAGSRRAAQWTTFQALLHSRRESP
jgi:hypothetical protein